MGRKFTFFMLLLAFSSASMAGKVYLTYEYSELEGGYCEGLPAALPTLLDAGAVTLYSAASWQGVLALASTMDDAASKAILAGVAGTVLMAGSRVISIFHGASNLQRAITWNFWSIPLLGALSNISLWAAMGMSSPTEGDGSHLANAAILAGTALIPTLLNAFFVREHWRLERTLNAPYVPPLFPERMTPSLVPPFSFDKK